MDCGTYTLVSARRGEGEEIKCKKEINAFIKIPLNDKFTFNMLKKSGVKLIERPGLAYAVGEAAVKIAYTMGSDLCRPMRNGTVNAQEPEAFEVLKVMLHSMVGEVQKDGDIVYYCVPADAVNANTNANYHQKVLQQIFDSYLVNNKRIKAYPINEALAIIFAECAEKNYSGIAWSAGSGMGNICIAMYSQSVAQFSVVNSGDWIDEQVAQATNLPVVVVNQEKLNFDLTKPVTTPLERALNAIYRMLVENMISKTVEAMHKTNIKARPKDPLDLVLGGGVTSPNGFPDLVKEVLKQYDFPIPIGDIIYPTDHIQCVARGCLVAAEQAV